MSHFEVERQKEVDRHQQIAGFLGNNLAVQTGSPQRDAYTAPASAYPPQSAAPVSAYPQQSMLSQGAPQPPASHPASPQRDRGSPYQSAAPVSAYPQQSAAPMSAYPQQSAVAPMSAAPVSAYPQQSVAPVSAVIPTAAGNGYFEQEKAKEEDRHQQIAQILGDNLAVQTGSPRRGSPSPGRSAYPAQAPADMHVSGVIVGNNPSQPVYESPVVPVSAYPQQSAAPMSAYPQQSAVAPMSAAPVSAYQQQSAAPMSAYPQQSAAPMSAYPQQSAAPVSAYPQQSAAPMSAYPQQSAAPMSAYPQQSAAPMSAYPQQSAAPMSAYPQQSAAPMSAYPQQSAAPMSAYPQQSAAPMSAYPQQSAAPVSYGSPARDMGGAPALPLTGQPGEGESPRRLKAWGESCALR